MSHRYHRKLMPSRHYLLVPPDELGPYRLLAAIYEVPDMLDELIISHPSMARDLCLAVMISASDRLLEIESSGSGNQMRQ
jgi:hypothetical protein